MSYRDGKLEKILPKTYLRKHVAFEIKKALIFFKYLEPRMDRYVYNDGTTKNLMSLSGTIPASYREKTYNIPVCVWIEENYPHSAPICFVRPTREMMIIRGPHVSSNGEVTLPYLRDWNKGECDILSLLQVMCATFGDSPPVCMRPQESRETSCALQFHREAEVLSKTDGSLYLRLEDIQALQQENETNC